jgi:hypothetical protein
MKLRSSILLAFVALAPLASACTVGDDGAGVQEAEANAAGVQPGSFVLYDEPNVEPNPNCNVHTKLALTDDGASRAALEEAVGGFCEIYVAPNPRSYDLKDAGTSCGSRIFTGTVRSGVELYSIRITDHRTRICRDLPPAMIIVEETRETPDTGPVTTTMYSHDRAGCDYGGAQHAVGARFPDADGCNTCTCTEDGVACTEMACAPQTCQVGDKTYAVGERFPDADGCNTCVCQPGGGLACTELFCPRD